LLLLLLLSLLPLLLVQAPWSPPSSASGTTVATGPATQTWQKMTSWSAPQARLFYQVSCNMSLACAFESGAHRTGWCAASWRCPK
jgi:hypothetical protein